MSDKTETQQPTEGGSTPRACSALQFWQRDTHHWDAGDSKGRLYAIRGEPGGIYVRCEARAPWVPSLHQSVTGAMAMICKALVDMPNIPSETRASQSSTLQENEL